MVFVLIIAVRSLLLYGFLVLVTRVMGKRQIGQLQPFEFVVTILLAELAAIPMAHKEAPLLNGFVAIFTLLVAHVALSFFTLKSVGFRRVVCGVPAVLIANGRIVEQQLALLRYNINDLLEQMRGRGYPNIAHVEFAILETNGQLSVIPKSQKRPVTPEDMQIATEYEGLPLTLIVDGVVDKDALQVAGLNVKWLQDTLHSFGINSPKDVLMASLDTTGKLYYQVKGEDVLQCGP